MKKLVILIAGLFAMNAYADTYLRIKHISFAPTESDKMTLFDENGQSHPITTHKFGTLIRAARDHKSSSPKKISIQPAPAEFAENFTVFSKDNDIYIKTQSNTNYKINSKMAWETCRNMFGCGEYLQKGIYSSWE